MTAPLSPRDAAILADDVEVIAFRDLYQAVPADLKATLGLEVQQVAETTLLVASNIPSSMFNRAIGFGLRRNANMEDLSSIVAAYRAAGSSQWWLHWNPHATSGDFAERLPALGFTSPARRSWAKMLRGTAEPPAIQTDLLIVTATDQSIGRIAEAITAAFEMPPFMIRWIRQLHNRLRWQVYAVRDGEEIVGGGCLFVDGDCAWLGLGSVLASHRRRGGQGRLMSRRIADAIAAGCRHIITETGEAMADEPNPSLANMKRCGFESVASRLNFVGPGRLLLE